ncbi:MAG TPA: (2Fe-2S)-binding protein [Burkholderiaceae bacterium]|nr:(2Fe-2S)-binding protein [Burkholderiaceae bacterium]
MSSADTDSPRREFLREAACVAGAWATAGALPAVAGATQSHPKALLVDAFGTPLAASRLQAGQAHVFAYPFVATPAFLFALPSAVAGTALADEAHTAYEAPAGVGPARAIVAFSAICAHKLMYPTPQISFIGLRRGVAGEPAHVIHCCGDQSRYDPAAGARVIGGPAPQPLAAVLLEWDRGSDRLYAVGTRGGDRFDAFFDKYAFKLEMDHGRRARSPVGVSTVVKAAADYSRQWQSCKVG